MRSNKTTRTRLLAVGVSMLSVLCLACLGEVEGERSETGACPEGEICSEATPVGLTFVGRAFFDEPTLRLGPVLVGGTLDLGLRANESAELPEFEASADSAVLSVVKGQGTFGPTDEEGEATYPVDGHITLVAQSAGVTRVRITDASTGELFDRLEIEAVELTDVAVHPAQDTEREALYAGCEEMVGVSLLADESETPVRGFDEGMRVTANGRALQEEPLFWDCVVYDVGADETEVQFEINVAGRTFTRTLPVVELEEGQMCPEPAD